MDGGPDENPSFPKTIDVYIQHFKRDFDVLLVTTNAPGLSAYIFVEQKMAPLSKELAGRIPHDLFGNHLDTQKKTVDLELEKENFTRQGRFWVEFGLTLFWMVILLLLNLSMAKKLLPRTRMRGGWLTTFDHPSIFCTS